MNRRSENTREEQLRLREKILGLGETSFRKSYYPELRIRLLELERFRFILDQVNVGIMIIDPKTKSIVDLNEETCRLLNKQQKELRGMRLSECLDRTSVLHPEMPDIGDGVAIIRELPSPDGESITLEITMHHVIFGGEEYRIAIIRDITRQRAAEEAIIRTKEMFESVIRISAVQDAGEEEILSATLSEVAKLTESTHAYCAILSPDESFFKISSSSDDIPAMARLSPTGRGGPWEEVIKRKVPLIGGRCGGICLPIFEGDKVVAVITLRGKPRLYDEFDLQVATYLGEALWQIILRYRAEENLRQLNEELERRVMERTRELANLNSELEAFTYSVSHDLRAPLRSINGFSLAILEDYGDELSDEAVEYLGRIRSASERMGTLIDDLLHLSRISRAELHRKEFSLSDLAHEVMNEIREQEPREHATVTIEDGMVVSADRGLMRSVLWNLLSNAWKFTSRKDSPEISFYSQKDGEKTTYIISDNGEGFDMAYVKHLFLPFSRLHTTDEFPGTGIGLATTARIISKHEGTIHAEGIPGQGATFYFTLGSKERAGVLQ
ncbi:MAG: Sensor histidine kinase, GAF domain-containing [Methanomicrobiales archaeon 53_19]|uniref:ATP-binding protein n=1 Tax=Methanocalculus sp. TaxID=2004547 RepID=UPI0007482F63|nr:ATP-binding protein [Methanocalculus sp.]KUL04165.1 MAG: Sensor histidine kinase, GAF domain-containing [Methanomicrobiales archaeon 53_19]HIJ07153.1 GAF domain-containing protein [Methanocalculus sp.]